MSLALVACDKDRGSAPQPAEPSPSQMARALGLDAATMTPEPPQAPAGDLRAEVDRFTTLDACMAEKAALDPLVGDALTAIGYDGFLRDACRVLAAMHTKRADPCTPIEAKGLKSTCIAYVAMQEGMPDACPWVIDDMPQQGRDPRCLAVASRDVRLCAGGLKKERAVCDAMLKKETAPCAGDAACVRDAQRWKNVLPPAPPPNAEAEVNPAAKLVLHGESGTTEPAQPSVDLTSDVLRGLVLVSDSEGTHVRFGTPHALGTTALVPPPHARTRLSFDLAVDAKQAARVESAELAIPGVGTLVAPAVRFDAQVKIGKLDAKRGAEVAFSIEGIMGTGTRAYAVHVDVRTFVRDVVVTTTRAPRARSLPTK